MTTVRRILSLFVFLLIIGGLTTTGTRAQQPAPAIDLLQSAQAGTTQSQTPVIETYVVGQARPPVEEGTPIVELTLEQAYVIALDNNLDLKVARMNPVSLDYTLQSMRASYRPSFSGGFSYRNSRTPSNNVLDGVANVTNTSQSYSSSVNQSIKWYGSPSVSASFSNGRSATNNVTSRLNPSFSSNLSMSFSMQLLNGFKMDNARNQWRTFPITREIADITLANTIENTKNSVRNSYWQLRSAIERVEIARRALEVAQKQYSDSLIRVEIGTSAAIDSVAFETAVANSEQSYLSSQISWRTAELNFKRLLVGGTDDPLYNQTINPVDRPQLSVESVDIQAAVTRALAERSDVVITRKNLEVSRMNLEVTKGALLPRLSFSLSYSASGQGGTQHIGGNTIPGNWIDAVGVLGSFQNPNWNMSFNLSYPLGQLSEKAALARAQISIDQDLARQKVQELTVSTAVINAGLAVNNAYKLYQAAVKSREASERNAAAAQVRFDNGLLTNFEVVQTQNSLTNARLSELNAIISYMNALAEFDRVQRIG